MNNAIEIQPTRQVHGSIRPPGSKSITNRAILCAALARGQSTLRGALDSDDTRVMVESLRKLGLAVDVHHDAHVVTISGCDGQIPASEADLFVGNSGTTVRFLTAALTLGQGRFRMDGVPRMRERPIADLLDALNTLGAKAISEHDTGAPPVVVQAAGLPGGTAQIAGGISSQFLSGILMAAPYARDDVTLIVKQGQLVSWPYVEMTLRVMDSFGVNVSHEDYARFKIPSGDGYTARDYVIEPDASAASYFWGAAAISGGCVTVEGLNREAIQGDVAFCECLEKMGCQVSYADDSITVQGRELHGIDVDMNAISDTVQTIGAVALFADGPTTVRGVAHIRHKETDRIGDLATELRKFGASAEETADGLVITPGDLQGARIETYDDHRMAMSLALVGLKVPGVVILNPRCTAKTYPNFFDDLARLTIG